VMHFWNVEKIFDYQIFPIDVYCMFLGMVIFLEHLFNWRRGQIVFLFMDGSDMIFL